MASQKLLNKIDPTGNSQLNSIQRLLVAERDSFLELAPHPTFEAKSWDLCTILDMIENFLSLDAFKRGEEWGLNVLVKCNCPGCHNLTHKDATCQHNVLLSMLGDPNFTIP